jgi:hypothetical protein
LNVRIAGVRSIEDFQDLGDSELEGTVSEQKFARDDQLPDAPFGSSRPSSSTCPE